MAEEEKKKVSSSEEHPSGSKKKDKNAPKKQNFRKGVRTEFNKITWPDKESLTKQTIAVIAVSVVISIVIALLDFVMKYGVDWIVQL